MKKAMQSPELTKFYQAYHAWLLRNAPPGRLFVRSAGLCLNLYRFLESNEFQNRRAMLEMNNQFEDAGLDEVLPFNSITQIKQGGLVYSEEVRGFNMHLNPHRVAWVESHLIEKEYP